MHCHFPDSDWPSIFCLNLSIYSYAINGFIYIIYEEGYWLKVTERLMVIMMRAKKDLGMMLLYDFESFCYI